MSHVGSIATSPTTPAPATVGSVVVGVTGFLLLAAAVASGVSAGIWAALIVGASVPLRHSLQRDSRDGRTVVRRRPLLLVLAGAMAAAGALLGTMLTM